MPATTIAIPTSPSARARRWASARIATMSASSGERQDDAQGLEDVDRAWSRCRAAGASASTIVVWSAGRFVRPARGRRSSTAPATRSTSGPRSRTTCEPSTRTRPPSSVAAPSRHGVHGADRVVASRLDRRAPTAPRGSGPRARPRSGRGVGSPSARSTTALTVASRPGAASSVSMTAVVARAAMALDRGRVHHPPDGGRERRVVERGAQRPGRGVRDHERGQQHHEQQGGDGPDACPPECRGRAISARPLVETRCRAYDGRHTARAAVLERPDLPGGRHP